MAIEKNLPSRGIDIPMDDDEMVVVDLGDGEDDGDLPDGYEMDDEGNVVESVKAEDNVPAPQFGDNLAKFLSDTENSILAKELIELFEWDEDTRSEWMKSYKRGLELLGLKLEERTQPWKGACGAFHPLLAEAVIRYSSEAILECWPASGPASYAIMGDETPDLLKRGQRVASELNYQLCHRMTEARLEQEMVFWRQPLAGSVFKKVWYDPVLKRARTRMVPAENFVVQYGASDLQTCGRFTEVIDATLNDIKRYIAAGYYIKYDPQKTPPIEKREIKDKTDKAAGQEESGMTQDTRPLLEMYVDLDLEGYEDPDGVPLPYVVTIDKIDHKVIAIYRDFKSENKYERNAVCYSHYKYLPGFGFYGTGLCQVLGGLTDSATKILRQLVDAGTLSNIPGGLKTRGLRIKGDDNPIRPGEFRDVDVGSGKIQDNIQFLPHKEPSETLRQLLDGLIAEGRRIGSVADAKIQDMDKSSPVGTALAIIERVMRVISATQARSNEALGHELKILAGIIATKMPDKYDFPVEGDFSRSEDFGPPINVIPVADPAATTIAQRIMRYRAVIDMAAQAPQVYDLALLHRQLLELLDIKNAHRIIPIQEEAKPMDPVSENMDILAMRPVKAFIEQDHDSHLKVHLAAMQNPLIQQIVGQGPNANQIVAAMSAHVQEHLGFAYRARMEKAMGRRLPPPGQPLPPEQAAELAAAAAEAADTVLQRDAAEAQMMANQATMADPKIQLEYAKLEDKKEDRQVKLIDIDRKYKSDKEDRDALIATTLIKDANEDKKLTLKERDLNIRAAVDLTRTEHQVDTQAETEDKRIQSQERIAAKQAAATRAAAKTAAKSKPAASKPARKPKK